MNVSPEMWAFFGTTVTAFSVILVAQISNGKQTRNAAAAQQEQTAALAEDVKEIKNGLHDHIRWHLERDQRVVIVPTMERR